MTFTFAQKEKARSQLTSAVRDGLIKKPERCFKCNKKVTSRQMHAHHYDYAQPLRVTWLCYLCHRRVHKFLDWFNACYGWLEYCAEHKLDPSVGRLPACNIRTGKPRFKTQFQVWKSTHWKR